LIREEESPPSVAHPTAGLTTFLMRRVAADKANGMGHIRRRQSDEPVVNPDAHVEGDLDRAVSRRGTGRLMAECERVAPAMRCFRRCYLINYECEAEEAVGGV
jgi:hypothetical protein